MKKIFLLAISLILFWNIDSKASHIAGADITYTCVGQDSFMLKVKIWRDCSGIDLGFTTLNVTASSPCGANIVATLNIEPPPIGQGLGNNGNGSNVSQLCPQDSCCASCFGATAPCAPPCFGNYPGMLEYVFSGLIVLTPNCNFWTIGYGPPCCRNTLVNTNSANTYVTTTLNTIDAPCNNSPEFTTPNPISYVCLNTPVCYDFGVVETDGDSLVYSIVDGFENAALNLIPYLPPYTGFEPILGVTIDPVSGTVNFTPTQAGNFLFVVQVNEYRNNVLIGTVMREMQFVVITCSNNPPNLCGVQAAITNFQGSGALINNNTVEVCYGQNFSFDVVVFDPDPGTILTAESNVSSVLPGATMTFTGTNPLTITIAWLAGPGANPFNSFYLNVDDNTCPIPARSSATYNVRVIESTFTGLDQRICRGVEQANISAVGGTMFTWSVLSGDPIIIGQNFSCNNCPNPIATPNNTTTYRVQSDLSSSCKNDDTVTVYVAENYILNTSPDTTICYNDSTIKIRALPTISAGFTYQWSPSAKLNADSVQMPLATPLTNTTFFVTTESDSGCIKTNEIHVRVTPPFPKEISIFSEDSVSCAGIPLQLDVQLGKIINTCAPTNDPCEGLILPEDIGLQNNLTTDNGNAAWPTPYANSVRSSRSQYLIRASELQALGVNKGTIYTLAFDVEDRGSALLFDDFVIKMKCTSDSVLSVWQTGMQTVFNPKLVTIADGWNEHILDMAYDYDGTSNLVIEVCFLRINFPTQNAITRYSNTTYNSSHYRTSNTFASACASNQQGTLQMARPNMRFGFCGGPNLANFNFNWSPSAGLSNDSIINPLATLSDSITYRLIVEDTTGSCIDTSYIKLDLSILETSNDTVVCPLAPLQLFASINSTCPGTKSYSWSHGHLLDNDTIATPIAQVDTPTMFYVTYSDLCGCTILDSVFVDIKYLPEPDIIKTLPSCGLANGSMLFDAFGGVPPYRFSIDSGTNYQSSNLFDSLNNDYYNIIIFDTLGCYTTLLDTFTNSAPIIDSLLYRDLLCFQGADAFIDIFSSEGIQPIVYSIDSGQSFYNTPNFSNLDSGFYYIVAMSADSCTTFPTEVLLDEPERLKSSIQIDPISCFNNCDGAIITTTTGGFTPYQFSWDSVVFTADYDSLCADTFYFTAIDSNLCQFDTSIVILNPDELIIDTIQMKDVSCYEYNNGSFFIQSSGGTGGNFYSIDSASSFFTANRFDSLSPGTYHIVVEDANRCAVSLTKTISEPAIMELTTNFDTTTICVSSCQEIIATVTGGNGEHYQYFWNLGLADTSYQLICPRRTENLALYATDSLGCSSNTKFLQINLFDSLKAVTNKKVVTCDAYFAQLHVTASGGDGNGYNYLWTPFNGLNNAIVPNPTALPGATTKYTVEVSDNCGSPSVFDTVLVEINPMPVMDISASNLEGCSPLEVILMNNGTKNNANCFWFVENQPVVNSCNVLTATLRNSGTYNLSFVIETDKGCKDTLDFIDYIEVYNSPNANFYFEPEEPTAFQPEVEFFDLSTGSVVSWLWQFGSLGNSSDPNPTFVFPIQDTATYPIKLTVTNSRGCKSDTIKNIFVDTDYYLFVPSAFSPNGDNLNEEFKPISNGVQPSKYQFFIYDRWGTLVFYSEDVNKGWDGRNQQSGEMMPTSSYAWKIILGKFAGESEQKSYSGSISLIR